MPEPRTNPEAEHESPSFTESSAGDERATAKGTSGGTFGVVVIVAAVATAMGGLSYVTSRGDADPPPPEVSPAASQASDAPDTPEAPETPEAQTVSLSRVREMIRERSAVLVDARSPGRFDQGHLPGAINLPATDTEGAIPDRLRRRARLQPVVVYCESETCPYADRVAKRLRRAGLHPVRVFEGGWRQWQQR